MVGANGFEPSTSWSRTRRASQAALRPDCFDLTTASEGFPDPIRDALARLRYAPTALILPLLQKVQTRAIDLPDPIGTR